MALGSYDETPRSIDNFCVLIVATPSRQRGPPARRTRVIRGVISSSHVDIHLHTDTYVVGMNNVADWAYWSPIIECTV